MGSPTAVLTLRVTIPLVIVASLAADLSVRLLPFDPWSPSAYLAAARWTGLDGTWRHNVRYEASHAYGELARIGRIGDMVTFRRETFSTDAFGYRNDRDLRGRTSTVLTGDSFALGLSLSDEQTLSAQLSTVLGEPVYNSALTLGSAGLARLRAVVRDLGITRGRIIFEYVNRGPLTTTSLRQSLTGSNSLRERLHTFPATAAFWPYLKAVLRPTTHLAAGDRLGWLTENDHVLPNPSARFVRRATLRNGQPMLFLPADVAFADSPHPVDPTVAAFVWLNEELRQDNLDLFVVLVPTGYTAYRPLLREGTGPPDHGGDYLSRLERRLRESGVRALNTSPALRAAAAAGLESDQYVYHLDDGHWNGDGVAVVARAVGDWLQRGTADEATETHAVQ